MAQNPETTEYDGMPRSAIATGLIDFISPAKSMPAELMQYVEHSFGKLPKMISSADTKEIFDKIFSLLKAQTTHKAITAPEHVRENITVLNEIALRTNMTLKSDWQKAILARKSSVTLN